MGEKWCWVRLDVGGASNGTESRFSLDEKGSGVSFWCLFANRDLSSGGGYTVFQTEKQGFLSPVRRGGGAERERRT